MRNITLAIFALAFSSVAFADGTLLYDGPHLAGYHPQERTAYETCIGKFKTAMHPQGLGLNPTYYSGKSAKANQRALFINGSYVKESERVKVGIACTTNYHGETVTSLKASIGGQYSLDEGATSPHLFADN